jgi:hypothetical protein
MARQRLTIVLDDNVAAQLVALAGSSRKQGEYLTRLIVAQHEGAASGASVSDLESIRMTLLGIIGTVRQLESRVMALEEKKAVVIV